MTEQLTLYDMLNIPQGEKDKSNYIVDSFSADHFCPEGARQELEKKYTPILDITDQFDRRSVSYQLSKKGVLHGWLKYKEGFSAELVNLLLDEMNIKAGDKVMDPFMGSGTTAMVCQMRGVHSVGYDIMPISRVSIQAKAYVMQYDLGELVQMKKEFCKLEMPQDYAGKTPYITITDTAYPSYNERFLQFSSEWIQHSDYSAEAKNLFTLCVMNSLERCSYTAKSGQYLSWDSRAQKVIDANKAREKAGRRLLPLHYCRKQVENIREATAEELSRVILDIQTIQQNSAKAPQASIDFTQNSVLFELPRLASDSINGVITSPPYCNRYDYTRTYALELVYLGLGEDTMKEMRQEQLSCTVESKSKLGALQAFYSQIGETARFERIKQKITENAAFGEILQALEKRKANGDLNNDGVIRMVEGYFTELAFVYAELFRVCKSGAMVVFVNDNVRYGGEVIPVDYLSTSFAEQFGFVPVKIYCLKQQKGNSSQQMKKYGRVALRKSITLWRKE